MARRQTILLAVPSAVPVRSAGTSRTVGPSVAALTKCKEIYITATGSYRVSFTIKVAVGGSMEVRIYKNGTAIGPLIAAPTTVTTYQDVFAFERGDLCQLYANEAQAVTSTVYSLVISASWSDGSGIPIPAGAILTDTNIT